MKEADVYQGEDSDKLLDDSIKHERPPVFTLTSAKKVRQLPDDGFCILKLDNNFENWKLDAYVCTDNQTSFTTPSLPIKSLLDWLNGWFDCDVFALHAFLRSQIWGIQQKRSIPSVEKGRGFAQKLIVPPNSEIIMIGDLHGCMDSLSQNLRRLFHLNIINNSWKLKDNAYLVFLGDLVDRGEYSFETCITVSKLLCENPLQCFACRGNHEVQEDGLYTNNDFPGSLASELSRRFKTNSISVLSDLNRLFAMFPDVVFVGSRNENTLK